MDKFKGKYRIASHRMPYWDYSGNGRYFITMVTEHREHYLGDIADNEMVFSDYGNIVEIEWHKSFEIRKELFLDMYTIMPNHIHAIVILDTGDLQKPSQLQLSPQFPSQRKPKSLSSFIAGFKSATNSKINDYIDKHQLDIPKFNRNNHFWQPNYHDRIIRNWKEYQRIAQYIYTNPENWINDRFYG